MAPFPGRGGCKLSWIYSFIPASLTTCTDISPSRRPFLMAICLASLPAAAAATSTSTSTSTSPKMLIPPSTAMVSSPVLQPPQRVRLPTASGQQQYHLVLGRSPRLTGGSRWASSKTRGDVVAGWWWMQTSLTESARTVSSLLPA